MLIIHETNAVHLKSVTNFYLRDNAIFFWFNYLYNDGEVSRSEFQFKNEETAKKAFDRIIYAYAKEQRILDLSEHAVD